METEFFRKLPHGTVNIFSRRSQEFSGAVEVLEGELNIGGSESFGMASFSVHGGRLALQTAHNDSSLLNADIDMQGGELAVSGRFDGVVNVLAPTRIVGFKFGNTASQIGEIVGANEVTFATENNRLMLTHENNNFSGDVIVEGSVIPQVPNAFGSGRITITAGGILDISEVSGAEPFGDVRNNITLAGGTVATDLSSTSITHISRLLGDIVAQEDSFLRSSRQKPIHIAGKLRLEDAVRLTKIGVGLLDISGELLVGKDSEIVSGPGFLRHRNSAQEVFDVFSQLYITGSIVSDTEEATLNFVRSGFDELAIDASFHVNTGQTLQILQDGQPLTLLIDGSNNTLTGSGTLLNPVEFGDGATISPGDSPGILSLGSSISLGSDAVYEWEINDALGTAGQSVGWDLLQVVEGLVFEATIQNSIELNLISLDGTGQEGVLENFDPSRGYQWLIASANSITGFDPAANHIDSSGFLSNNSLSPHGQFVLRSDGSNLFLVHQVPEPSTLLVAFAVLSLGVLYRPVRFHQDLNGRH